MKKIAPLSLVLTLLAAVSLASCSPNPGDRNTNVRGTGSVATSSQNPDQFTVQPAQATMDGESLLVFTYPTVRAARLDAAKLSEDGLRIGIKPLPWTGTPHFFRKENETVLYLGTNASILEKLRAEYGEQFAGT